MSELGADFAWGRITGQALRAAGLSFVCRYLSPDSSKNITRAEAAELHAAGLAIVLVWESTGGRALAGMAAGVADAHTALAQAEALGAPGALPIYFAVDFDPMASQLEAVARYFMGVRSVLGYGRTGVYGGFPVLSAILGLHARYGWQTVAWSAGRLHSGAALYQFSNGHQINGVSVDFDRAEHADYGGWHPAAHTAAELPHGVARAALTCDLGDGDWTVRGTAGFARNRPHFGKGGGAWEVERLPAEGDWWCAKVRIHRGA